MLTYENVFRANGKLFARLHNTDTNITELLEVDSVPKIYVKSQEETSLKTPRGESLKEVIVDSPKEFYNALKSYQSSSIPTYGHKSFEFSYIRENFPESHKLTHKFSNIFYLDIETMVDDSSVPKKVSKDDWKPMGHERAAMATITSIQIYSTKNDRFYFLSLKKDWKNPNNIDLGSEIVFKKYDTEEELLKAFLTLLRMEDPALISGWNTRKYDYPFITNRIIRVLDKRTDLYQLKDGEWKFNVDCLKGNWVKKLSPVGEVTHREVPTNFKVPADDFSWKGIILEDHLELYKKYTYLDHTSYSLQNIATFELGAGKVNHDEFTDFGAFYKGDYNFYDYNPDKEDKTTLDIAYEKLMENPDDKKLQEDFKEQAFDQFVTYGLQDTNIIKDLEDKLQFIMLIQTISYICGVTIDDIRGTMKQWNNFMFNEHLKRNIVLKMTENYPNYDTTFVDDIKNGIINAHHRKEFYDNIPFGQNQTKFAGGVVRATTKFSKWAFSLDFASLYPSVMQWLNVGIETVIHYEDLPKELKELRAKYAVFYPEDVAPKDLVQFDLEFLRNTVYNKENAKEISETLKKYNVSMSPNGVFFDLSKRSVTSLVIEGILDKRSVYKKDYMKYKQLFEETKNPEHAFLRDLYNTYQMAMKILANSMYGAFALIASNFAGNVEMFSVAITSGARNSNLLAGQTNSMLVAKLSEKPLEELQYGYKNFLDYVVQQDTDSNYITVEQILIKEFGENYEEVKSKRELAEYVEKYIEDKAIPTTYKALGKFSDMLNAMLPEKLQEDAEIIADNFISIAPKMYFANKVWEEGYFYDEKKLKITGLSTVRSSTPKFFRSKLKEVMEILIDGDIDKVVSFNEKVLSETYKQNPSDICVNQSVNSLDYDYIPQENKWKRFTGDKFLTSPRNSTGALFHNKFLDDKNISSIPKIEEGDKVGFVLLRQPNVLDNSDVISFKNEKVFDYVGKEYIDYGNIFNKYYKKQVELITKPIGWSIERKEFSLF